MYLATFRFLDNALLTTDSKPAAISVRLRLVEYVVTKKYVGKTGHTI